ncbi:hypothetical protein CFP71_42390, partial [Amycolatopsis thailandensis]
AEHEAGAVRIQAVRLDGDPTPADGTRSADPLAALDAELDAHIAGTGEVPGADERGEGRTR